MKIDKNLVKGSVTLLIAFNIFNALNFVFHFSMVRMLSIVDYGILATLFTITYALAVFSESIQVVITKYSAQEDENGKLKNIIKRSFKKAFYVSVVLFLVYAVVSIPLSGVLDIEYSLIVLNGIIIFSIFFAPITRGVLQGRKRFMTLGSNMAIEAVFKLGLAILLVYLGWRVYGALIGTLIGMGLAILLSFVNLKDIIRSDEKKAETVGIYGYSLPAFFIMFVILIFYSVDVIIAKIFFSPEIAGFYAIASILSKTIFLGTQPVSRAMFPITAENSKNTDEKSHNSFINAVWILIGMVIASLVIFYFASGLVIRIFSGKYINQAAEILFYLGIATSIISFANLILLYRLSWGKIKSSSLKMYVSVIGMFVILVLVYLIYSNYLIGALFYLLIILYLIVFVLTAYCFAKKQDLGILLFLLIEIPLLSYFSGNLFQFSIAFIAASAVFLWGAVFLLND